MLVTILQFSLLCLLLIPTLYLWRRITTHIRHLDGPRSSSFWTGNLGQIYSKAGWQFHREIVENYGGAVKINGLLGCQLVYLSDPKALQFMLVKDSSITEETTWYTEGNQLVFGPGLLSTVGDHHKKQRKLLNPVFSAKHIRNLVPIFQSVSEKLKEAIAYQVKEGPRELDMLGWMSRAALEIVGLGGLGTSIDPLSPDPESMTKYGKAIKNLIPAAFRLSIFRFFIPAIVKFGPPSFRRFLIDVYPNPDLKRVRDIVDVMAETSTDIFREKLRAFQQGDQSASQVVGEGKDVMSILLRANQSASLEDSLPNEELIAQMSTFMFAGHDTTSSALSRTLCCLATEQNVQQRLRDEIISSGIFEYGDPISYDALMDLPFLDAVCKETLRVHPPINFMMRTALKDAVLPLSRSVKATDGVTEINELHVRKGQDIFVAFGEVNRLKSVWGNDAYEWRPERWLSPLPDTVGTARIPGVYSSLMTFSAGPRSCIGFKFAELEMKMILAVLVKSFVFEFPEKREIVWNLGGIQTPSVKGAEAQTPHLPMKVTLLSSKH